MKVPPADQPDVGLLRVKSLELLDYPAIRQGVAGRANFLPARKLAMDMEPSYLGHEVDALQRQTAEGLTFLDEAGDVSLHATEDAAEPVERAEKGGGLTGLELLAVADSLEVQRRARSAVLSVRHKVPVLAGVAEGIPDLREVQGRVRAAIGMRGEVVDSATPTLGALRQQVRNAYQRVTQALESVLHSSVGQEALQDQVISMRSERLVVQVKMEMRHRVPGIVHDSSNTGATLFVEPFATVELCNAWRELVLEEERETARVLRELSELVGAVAEDVRRGTELTAQLDFILARARYSASLEGVAAVRNAGNDDGRRGERSPGLRLIQARHPLLGGDAVPVSVNVGPDWSTLVITGPNTGGKTVAMKTVGLLALMNQSGLQVPAEDGSSLPVFDGVYADVGDQQSIESSVSTFSSHMRNVIDILSQASADSLVLLDELGTSTDPEEGSALAKSILGHLASRAVSTIVTTHHRAVAAYAEATAGIMNASVDLDADTLRPTYHLTMGVPGRSYAMSVASQLGLPEEIMDEALSQLEPQYLRFEDWLSELQKERDQLKVRLTEAEQERAQARASRRELDAQLEELELRREDMLHGMRGELTGRFDDVRRKLRRAEAALSWGASSGQVEEAREEIASTRRELQSLEAPPARESQRREQRPLAPGDLVDVRGLNVQGTVISIPEHGDEIEVVVGNVHFRLDAHRLTPAEPHEDRDGEEARPDIRYELGPLLETVELDLRGARAQEALLRVEEFLDKALRDGMSSVRIIHGKGTGALRQAVRELLDGHPLAKSFASEAHDRGGDGATVVELT